MNRIEEGFLRRVSGFKIVIWSIVFGIAAVTPFLLGTAFIMSVVSIVAIWRRHHDYQLHYGRINSASMALPSTQLRSDELRKAMASACALIAAASLWVVFLTACASSPRPVGSVSAVSPGPRDMPRQASALIRILVGKDGSVREAVVEKSTGSAELDRAALEMIVGVEKHRLVIDGVPVDGWVRIPVHFRASESGDR